MPLYIRDLDPVIAERVLRRRGIPTTYLRTLKKGRRNDRPLYVVAACVFAFVAVASFTTFLLLLGVACVCGFFSWITRLSIYGFPGNAPIGGVVTARDLEAVAGQTESSGQETAYCRVLASLAEGLPGLDDGEVRRLLPHLGELLEKSRALRAVEEQLEQVLRTDSAYRLEGERDQMRARLQQTADPMLEATLAQALALNAERLANAQVFAATAERLAAQREVIAQALASVHSTLIRSRLAVADMSGSEVIRGVVETVARTNAQTQAVEQAVAEMVALQAA